MSVKAAGHISKERGQQVGGLSREEGAFEPLGSLGKEGQEVEGSAGKSQQSAHCPGRPDREIHRHGVRWARVLLV